MKRTRSTSLPVVVLIAVAALVLGSFGSAHAAALTATSVKKIAAKVVTKKAPTLSVAHADSAARATKADSATKADLATKATTATTADDAGKLAGQSPQLYLDRIGFVTANHVLINADAGNTLATVTITVPQGASIIHALGNASLPAGAADTPSVWTRIDTTDCSSLSGADWTRRSMGRGPATLTTQIATPVTAGAHTVVLCGSTTTNGIFADVASLSVTTVPRGSSGGGSL